MTVSLRHLHEFKDYNLEKLYGVLKTYELEIQQDGEIEKGQRKDKSVALVAKNKEVWEESSGVVVSEAPSRNVGESKLEAGKGKGKAKIEDESMHQEDLDDIDDYLAFLSRR